MACHDVSINSYENRAHPLPRISVSSFTNGVTFNKIKAMLLSLKNQYVIFQLKGCW